MIKFLFRDMAGYHIFYYSLLVFSYGFLANLAHGKNSQLH